MELGNLDMPNKQFEKRCRTDLVAMSLAGIQLQGAQQQLDVTGVFQKFDFYMSFLNLHI